MDKKQELYIIGNPRSGTSLLRIMLNSHPEIAIPPECGFIQWWYDKYSDWPGNHQIDDFIIDLKTSKKIETWQIDFNSLKDFIRLNKIKTYNDLVFSVVEFYSLSKAKTNNPKVVGDKNNYYINHLDLLKKISPKAKFLLIIRDPKDIYCSYKNIIHLNTTSKYKPNLSKSINEFIAEWTRNHEIILSFFRSLNKEQFFLTKYHNLILDTENELSKICEFLDLEFNENMLSYYLYNDEPKDMLDWKKKTLKPLDKESLGRYKSELTPQEIEFIDNTTKNLLNANLRLNDR